MFRNLFKGAEVRRVKVDGTNYILAAGTTDVDSEVVDVDGYSGLAWIVGLGIISASGAVSVKAQQGLVSNLSDAADLLGTSQGATADTDDNKVILLDFYKPAERYQRLHITRGDGGNSVIDFVLALLYHAGNEPVTQGATVFGLETFNTCREGTA